MRSIKKQLEGKLDSSKCGALLTWEYYFPHKAPPSFLYLINERDCGNIWKQPQDQYWGSNANIFHQWCHSEGRSFELFDRLEKLSLDDIFELTIGAKKELAEKREYCTSLLPSIEIIDWEGYKTAYIELEKAVASDLGKMIVDTLEVDVALMLRDHYELRSSASKGTVDVSLIAKKYGGGGHRHAAGFSIQNKLSI